MQLTYRSKSTSSITPSVSLTVSKHSHSEEKFSFFSWKLSITSLIMDLARSVVSELSAMRNDEEISRTEKF